MESSGDKINLRNTLTVIGTFKHSGLSTLDKCNKGKAIGFDFSEKLSTHILILCVFLHTVNVDNLACKIFANLRKFVALNLQI